MLAWYAFDGMARLAREVYADSSFAEQWSGMRMVMPAILTFEDGQPHTVRVDAAEDRVAIRFGHLALLASHIHNNQRRMPNGLVRVIGRGRKA